MDLRFDANQVEPASFAPPPPLADYHVKVVESEAKPTAAGDGGFLELMLEILDPGPYLGRKIPYRLNIYNKNAQTVEIAYRQLSSICHVTRVFQVTDSRQLHNIPFMAKIGPQANNPQYANVFAVMDLNGVAPGKAASGGAPPAPPVAAAPPAWGAPSAPPAAPAPAWGPPAAAAPPAPAPAWAPPGAPQAAPAAPVWGAPPAAPPAAPGAPPWQQGPPAANAAPPWAK